MIDRESAHLRQAVLYRGRPAVVDALTWDSVGLSLRDGGYVVCGYGEVSYVEAESEDKSY